MRTKSNARRQAILDVAAQTFRELGYERTTMGEIRSRVGGSKATLYNYFPSKEELFFAVIAAEVEADVEAIYTCLDPAAESVVEALHAFGDRLLRALYAPCAIALRRLVIAEAGRSNLGVLCYEHGPKRGHGRLGAFLRAAMAQGRLPEADARVAAWHLYGLLEAELLQRGLLCAQDPVTDDEIAGCVQRAVAVFMAAYGPPTGP
jgi:AcrR family transcriptional regulator